MKGLSLDESIEKSALYLIIFNSGYGSIPTAI